MSLIAQTSRTTDIELSILVPLAFIAVLPKANGFREAYLFATDLLVIKKFARMAALQHF